MTENQRVKKILFQTSCTKFSIFYTTFMFDIRHDIRYIFNLYIHHLQLFMCVILELQMEGLILEFESG